MNDLDLKTNPRLAELTERLRRNDPLSLGRESFLREVKARGG